MKMDLTITLFLAISVVLGGALAQEDPVNAQILTYVQQRLTNAGIDYSTLNWTSADIVNNSIIYVGNLLGESVSDYDMKFAADDIIRQLATNSQSPFYNNAALIAEAANTLAPPTTTNPNSRVPEFAQGLVDLLNVQLNASGMSWSNIDPATQTKITDSINTYATQFDDNARTSGQDPAASEYYTPINSILKTYLNIDPSTDATSTSTVASTPASTAASTAASKSNGAISSNTLGCISAQLAALSFAAIIIEKAAF